jgi:hypothetical protein
MTKLHPLRRQLSSLRRARQSVRWTTAYSALVTAVLLVLAGVLLLDVGFQKLVHIPLGVPERVVLMLVGGGVLLWAFTRYTLPLLGVKETDLEMALLVERQQRIDSDLVAALQFESPQAATWGSPQLETAVVDYVAVFSPRLNVFEGFSREQMVRRGLLLTVTSAAVVAFALLLPDYANIFLNRLLLAAMHYPTDTVIEQVMIDDEVVLVRERHRTLPARTKSAQGQPLAFAVLCSGKLPADGLARLSSSEGQRRPVELRKLSLEERLGRLRDAESRLREVIEKGDAGISENWRRETAALVRFDVPYAARLITESSNGPPQFDDAVQEINKVIGAWPGRAEQTAVYVGSLARLIDSVRYNVHLGDASTDSAEVAMIPLPVVEPKLTPIAPDYARTAVPEAIDTSARQLSVLEGSQVKVAVECTNKKRLTAAWLVVKSKDEPQRISLTKQDNDGYVWALTAADTPFTRVLEEIRFEIQVTDEDGLQLETPIRGLIRLKADRPPTGSADVVHRVVLPAARPVISYRAMDDYGISRLLLHMQVQRGEDSVIAGAADDPSAVPAPEQSPPAMLRDGSQPLLADQLPTSGRYELDLTPLNLVKGDRLKLNLEVVDYRGDSAGESYLSEPLILEISDEAGVLAAIAAEDQRSEQRLTDIIKQQLGIGESP